MLIELTETEAATIITALVLYAHIPKLTMDEDQKQAERLYKELKDLHAQEVESDKRRV